MRSSETSLTLVFLLLTARSYYIRKRGRLFPEDWPEKDPVESLQVLILRSILGRVAVSGPLILGCSSQADVQANIYDRTSPELV